MRTHELFLRHYAQLREANTAVARDELAQYFGINGECLFARLRSIELPSSFPYDIMHLFFENLVPNMIKHWISDFKGLDEGTGTYKILKAQWIIIGSLTALATRTIPSVFVGTLPDIAEYCNLYKAEAYSFWIQYLAPILLKGVLPNKYHKHLVELRKIILLCLQFKITHAEVDELQLMVNKWVQDYEKFYYQYQESRLPTCPLTIHALLHIPYYIQRNGPLWTSWAFVMERFCGRLLPAVKNRVRPYDHLAHYIERRAQLQVVACKYNMLSLTKARFRYRYVGKGEISSHEIAYKDFDSVVLGRPINQHAVLDPDLKTQMARYFSLVYEERTMQQLRSNIAADSLIRYGRFRITEDGDRFRTAALIDWDPLARDNSYIKYDLCPDRNTAFWRRRDRPIREVQYGQLLDIYYVEYIEQDVEHTHVPYLLARVQECNTGGQDAAARGTSLVQYDRLSAPYIIHLETIMAVVGRVSLGGNKWAIVDRSRDGVHTQFLDDDGNIDLDVDL